MEKLGYTGGPKNWAHFLYALYGNFGN